MDIQEAIKQKEDAIYGKGASEKQIETAESALGLRFASDYKDYLKTFSLVMYDGHELTGISNDKRVDVVEVTNAHKNEITLKDLYVIEETGIDGIVIWQNSNGQIFQDQKCIAKSLVEYVENF